MGWDANEGKGGYFQGDLILGNKRDKIENMIVMGVIGIIVGILTIRMGNGWYQKAKTDLPCSEHKKCVKRGDFCFTIGVIELLAGVFLIIGILL